MMTQTSLNLVTRELAPDARRMAITGKYFGLHFPLRLEQVIYGITERMTYPSLDCRVLFKCSNYDHFPSLNHTSTVRHIRTFTRPA